MRDTYYYLDPSDTFSGLTAIAKRIVDAAKNTYGGCVMNKLAIELMVDEMNKSAREMKKAFPRGKVPRIELVENPYTDSLHINVDGWSIICHKVKDITPMPLY